ncbi:hypothetical protein ElyMa_002117300 [Elysia marginata]|uniref:DUF393 domain-containing protein n=1 Tax=Elysia marginata TaxID=1093978 RepID=A0AAV4FH17_9GAST|nr:hypothetical protein ElyMa_002117300 [Elysia marginata]
MTTLVFETKIVVRSGHGTSWGQSHLDSWTLPPQPAGSWSRDRQAIALTIGDHYPGRCILRTKVTQVLLPSGVYLLDAGLLSRLRSGSVRDYVPRQLLYVVWTAGQLPMPAFVYGVGYDPRQGVIRSSR